MSIEKIHNYNAKFSFKTLQANCQRASCKVHIFIKIQNEQRKLPSPSQMKKNLANINSQLQWPNIALSFNPVTGTYNDTMVTISIHYQTLDSSSRPNNLKIGHVTINLGKLLNTKTYRIVNQYSLEKCYDPNAKLKVAIDLQKEEDQDRGDGRGDVKGDGGRGFLGVSSTWRTSKVRDRMMEQQKMLVQNKLVQYQSKIDRYRDEHNDQIRRLNQQLQRKQQRIQTLTLQSHSLTQSLQHTSLQSLQHKQKQESLQKQLLLQTQQIRSLNLTKQQLVRQLNTKKLQLQQKCMNMQQLEQAKEKKQTHYKGELQKYMGKFVESQNVRNRIVFEMENKMKEELNKKQDIYKESISKLQTKLNATISSLKQSLFKKQKQLQALTTKQLSLQQQSQLLAQQLSQSMSAQQSQTSTMATLQQDLLKSKQKIKCLQSQSQMQLFSNTNLQRQLQRLRSQQKIQQNSLQQHRYQLQIANRTIQQQQAILVKLNRNIKMHQQRQYYMEQKYQDQLEQKTYNEQCIMDSNNYYKNIVRKQEIKIKFIEQKIEEQDSVCQGVDKENKKLQEEGQAMARLIFENGHQILRLQNQCKKISEKCEEVEFQYRQKIEEVKALEQKMEIMGVERDREVAEYAGIVGELERKVKEGTMRMAEMERQWQIRMEQEDKEKGDLLAQLQVQVDKLRQSQNTMKASLTEHQQKQQLLQTQLDSLKTKLRMQDRQYSKQKMQLSHITTQNSTLSQSLESCQQSLSSAKSQLHTKSIQLQKVQKKQIKQKQAYTQLIKWIFDRNWEQSAKTKYFVAGFMSQIAIELLDIVNQGLQGIYSYIGKIKRQIETVNTQNEKLLQQVQKAKLQAMYQHQFGINKQKQQPQHIDWITRLNQPKQRPHYMPSLQQISISSSPQHHPRYDQQISQLQRQLSHKSSQIQTLNQQLFQQRSKTRELTQQIRSLNQDMQQLLSTLAKKNVQINNLQTQISQRDIDLSSGYASSYARSSPNRHNDYKGEVESKFREQKIIGEFQSKLELLDRENGLQKSKIDLLEGKVKSMAERNINDAQKIQILEKSIRQKQQNIKKLSKDNEQKQKTLTKLTNQLQIANSKILKKESTIQQLKNQLQQQHKITQILTKQLHQHQQKSIKKQKQFQHQSHQSHRQLLQSTQSLTQQLLQKQHSILQLQSQLATLRSTLTEMQNRNSSLEDLLNKVKLENQALYQKYLRTLAEKNEMEEDVKDRRMMDGLAKQGLEKRVLDLEEALQSKQFQIQQMRFKCQSRVLQLQKMLQDRDHIQQT